MIGPAGFMAAPKAEREAVAHVAPYKNRAHRAAFADGHAAARAGLPRSAPYGIDSRASRYFRRAWLHGYDEAVGTPPAGGDRAG